MADNQEGTLLSCTDDSCGCKLRIEKPCPHGDTYKCACGHDLKPTDG